MPSFESHTANVTRKIQRQVESFNVLLEISSLWSSLPAFRTLPTLIWHLSWELRNLLINITIWRRGRVKNDLDSLAKVCSLTPNSLLLHRTIHHMFIQLVPPVKRSATKLAIILKTPRKMFVFYVILSMRLLAKTSATHCTLELHLAVLRLIFLNVIDKHLSGLTCKLRIADIQHQYTHTRTHSPNKHNTPEIHSNKCSRNASI